MTWNDAKAQGRLLSQREGVTYRLPTEAEWEYAARAGTRTRFPAGDAPEVLLQTANTFDREAALRWPRWREQAGAGSDGFAFTAPVGSFAPNAFGLYDMVGTVRRCVADWYDEAPYAHSRGVDPQGRDRVDSRAKVHGHALTLEYKASDMLTLKSISAYRKFRQSTIMNLSGQGNLRGFVLDPATYEPAGVEPVNLFNGNGEEKQWQFSQELQLKLDADKLKGVLGLYYLNEHVTSHQEAYADSYLQYVGTPLNFLRTIDDEQDTKSYAAFGEAYYELSPELKLTAGGGR